jgi:hypothetical protein
MRMIDARCETCGRTCEFLLREGTVYPECCGAPMVRVYLLRAAKVQGDDIPGGIEILHGICNEDGTPKRYYSKSAIKQACAVKGVMPYHDVYAEGGNQTLADARHRDDWLKTSTARRAKRDRDEARREKAHR